ncbi:Mitochondrial outer membrane protein iml2 [Trapelia coarctata]|nr:Mitochondrial outer membrane protein iml2 [Trapelia coarctata]
MFRGWMSSKKAAFTGSTHSLDAAAELANLEQSMKAATHIMNDDLESAEAGLNEGNSSYHKLGKGVVAFLRAALGFEPEIMKEAAERLAEAETTASADYKRAQKETQVYRSSIYPPGSEFSLCHAQSQLMSAVVGLLNENLMEGLKSFYKMRKAFMALDAILEAERKYMQSLADKSDSIAKSSSLTSLNTTGSRESGNAMPGGFGDGMSKSQELPPIPRSVPESTPNSVPKSEKTADSDSGTDSPDNFVDADEGNQDATASATNGNQNDADRVTQQFAATSLRSPMSVTSSAPFTPRTPRTPLKSSLDLLEHNPESDIFANPIDRFVHSGANLCFGMLLLILSMIPPAFGKLLYIIGFRGDRPRGVRMLWQASKFQNINGAMAGLILLGYYNGLIGFCDILPDTPPPEALESDPYADLEGYPQQRLEALLVDMRVRYPKSNLWLLEEARMEASHKNLGAAIDLLSGSGKSPLKQVEALSMFEKSLNAMYSHRYELCCESFLECVRLNNWSHALYYYIAGASHVQLYRQAKTAGDSATAEKHAAHAAELMGHVREHAGKKKFMARQLPFDIFVVRKLNKWEARAKEWNIPFIDAIGISPHEEMIYFWNGNKRMTASQLQDSLDNLAWSEDVTQNPTWPKESLDEQAILAVLRSAIYRQLGQYEKARELLKKEVVSHEKIEFKGGLKDDWTAPTAHYEMGACLWAEREGVDEAEREKEGAMERDRERVREAEGWVDKAGKWEAYELDARVGLKIATGLDTLRAWRGKWDEGYVKP